MGTTSVNLRRIKEVWVLRNERGTVFLESTGRRIARVLGGTVFSAGDWVERPAGISWEDALQRDDDGHSLLSPFGLELVFDSRTRSSLLGPLPSEVPDDELRERDRLVREILNVLHPDEFEKEAVGP